MLVFHIYKCHIILLVSIFAVQTEIQSKVVKLYCRHVYFTMLDFVYYVK